MRDRISKHTGTVALAISVLALIGSSTGLAEAARRAVASAIDGHRISCKPYPNGLLTLGRNKKFAAAAIPTVNNAQKLGGKSLADLEPSCPPSTVNLGTWCLDTSPYPLTNAQAGQNNYFFATQACVKEGGYLPTAAQLIGAANRVKLESTIHDNPDTATIDLDPSVGLKDQREMSATLVTTAAGSDAAGSEGVSVGATGDPRTGEPDPVSAGGAGALDAAVRDGLFKRREGRLRRLGAGLAAGELPLRVQRDARREHGRRRVSRCQSGAVFTEWLRVEGRWVDDEVAMETVDATQPTVAMEPVGASRPAVAVDPAGGTQPVTGGVRPTTGVEPTTGVSPVPNAARRLHGTSATAWSAARRGRI